MALDSAASPVAPPASAGNPSAGAEAMRRFRESSEYIAIPLIALIAAAILFALFLLAIGRSPADFLKYVWIGGFGTSFSFQNTLQRSAPLILTALAVAIPARIGLIVIGGEGALVLGGFAAAAAALPMLGVLPPLVVLPIMFVIAAFVGAVWVGIAGFLRYARGVNETISSLLLTYIGIAIMNFFVEGALRDLSNPNKPSTRPIGDAYMVGKIPGTDVHWGLATGVILAIALHILMNRTTFGFAARMTGGNFRAALAQGLAGRQDHRRLLDDRRLLRRHRRVLRGRGHPGARQRFARRGLRLHRHPGVVSRAAQSAGDRARRSLVRRLWSPRAASCRGAWSCPTPPCWCCRA